MLFCVFLCIIRDNFHVVLELTLEPYDLRQKGVCHDKERELKQAETMTDTTLLSAALPFLKTAITNS